LLSLTKKMVAIYSFPVSCSAFKEQCADELCKFVDVSLAKKAIAVLTLKLLLLISAEKVCFD